MKKPITAEEAVGKRVARVCEFSYNGSNSGSVIFDDNTCLFFYSGTAIPANFLVALWPKALVELGVIDSEDQADEVKDFLLEKQRERESERDEERRQAEIAELRKLRAKYPNE